MTSEVIGLKGRLSLLVLGALAPVLALVVAFWLSPSFADTPWLLIGLIVTAATAVLSMWFGAQHFILPPIVSLTQAARRIQSGDLTPVEKPDGAHELIELTTTFNEMAGALRRINRAHATLRESKQLVLRATNETSLLSGMCRIVVRQVGYRGTYIVYAGNDEKHLLQPMAHEGFIGGIPELKRILADVSWVSGNGPIATTVRTGKPYVAQHLMTDPNFAPWRPDAERHGVASLACFPISVDNNVIGALAIYAEEPDAFDRHELQLLTEAVQDLSVGIALLRARDEHSRASATIERMEHYDRLTGLPNHALFEERLHRAMAEARSFNRTLGAFIVDLNRLRDINDAFGFSHGDQVLKEVSNRLAAQLPPHAILARMRGDEFAIICRVERDGGATEVANKILHALEAPFTIEGTKIDVTSTIGISIFPQDGNDTAILMRHADVAMHEAKKRGQRIAFYTREQDEHRAQRLALVGQLRRAIEANELVLHYQPKINMLTSRVCGVEALIRWMHPERGMLAPDHFIGLAETSGLIKPLTYWVIGTALHQSSLWRRAGVCLPIAINLSPYNLRDSGFPATVGRYLQEWHADASWLEFEITEGAVMEDPEGALEILKTLRQMGIALSIDDFGTGYSSLGYLKKLPVDAVKIDKSFVIDMTENPDSEAIVRTTITLGHELNLKVVAEGVENRAALNHLATLCCDVAQGYFIAKPLPPADLIAWLDQGFWHRPDVDSRSRKPHSSARNR